MYKLYTDKIENFEAKIKLEGASLKQSKARLVIEADGFDVMFKGTISNSGIVKVPVKRFYDFLEAVEKSNELDFVLPSDLTNFFPISRQSKFVQQNILS